MSILAIRRWSSSPVDFSTGPSPDPDKEISTIRLFCRYDLRNYERHIETMMRARGSG
jgi:hypothetical protein